MIKIQEVYLVTRNARDKVQTARYVLEHGGNHYVIRRFTGQFAGKITTQPEKIIEKGKAKRSLLQQAELEFNSLIKKATDKGYKKLTDLTNIKWEKITVEEISSVVPSIKTDSNGNIKPQQAKAYKDCSTNVLNKQRYASRKLDGVRCLMKWDKESGEVKSVSRGGGDYDIPTTNLRNNETLIEIFKENPDLILDGEIYVHGWILQKISGTARLKTWDEERCSQLEYWVYDVADVKLTFDDRYDILESLRDTLGEEDGFEIVEHIVLEGWEENKKYHDRWVSEGFEGLVSRHADKVYEPGKRNSDWIKLKEYQDDEFEITGISEGLRIEDLCFTMITKKGKEFKAKPIGNRGYKQDIYDNWPSYVGKWGTVKFFDISEDGIPTQPVFKTLREKGE